VHHWQQHFGKPSVNRYHNKEWAERMEALGLMPSDTGEPGGKRVGQKVTHYIVAGGAFADSCRELLAGGVKLQWQSRKVDPDDRKKKNRSKTKYTCPGCGVNAWGKPGVILLCGECNEELEPESP
jgi:hypothetical protein